MIDSVTVQKMVLSLRDQGLSQVQVAELLNTSQTTISRWERGLFSSQADSLARLIQLSDQAKNKPSKAV